jgi:hypothetical protein
MISKREKWYFAALLAAVTVISVLIWISIHHSAVPVIAAPFVFALVAVVGMTVGSTTIGRTKRTKGHWFVFCGCVIFFGFTTAYHAIPGSPDNRDLKNLFMMFTSVFGASSITAGIKYWSDHSLDRLTGAGVTPIAAPAPRRRVHWFQMATLTLQVAGIGVGLLVIWQINIAQKQITDGAYAAAGAWMLDLDKQFVDHPELRPFFYESEKITKTTPVELKRRVDATSEYMLDVWDSFLHTRFGGSHRPLQPSWRSYMIDVLNSSNCLVRYCEDHVKWYNQDGEFYQLVYEPWRNSPAGRRMLAGIESDRYEHEAASKAQEANSAGKS